MMNSMVRCGRTLALVAGAAFLVAAGLAARAVSDERSLPACPIMGEPINLSVSTETSDGPAYFCCAGCVKKYKANPEKYASQMNEQRKTLSNWPKVQVKCPLDGKPVVVEASIEKDGEKVHFCSKQCAAKYETNPEQYNSALANSYTHQAMCPVTGQPIDPASSTTLPTGSTVFFCSPTCEARFLSNLDEFAPKLASQGYGLNIARLKKHLGGSKSAKKVNRGQQEH